MDATVGQTTQAQKDKYHMPSHLYVEAKKLPTEAQSRTVVTRAGEEWEGGRIEVGQSGYRMHLDRWASSAL